MRPPSPRVGSAGGFEPSLTNLVLFTFVLDLPHVSLFVVDRPAHPADLHPPAATATAVYIGDGRGGGCVDVVTHNDDDGDDALYSGGEESALLDKIQTHV